MKNFETEKNSERGKTVEELKAESARQGASAGKESRQRTRVLIEKISGQGTTKKGTISALNQIQELNKMLLPKYIMKLEEAANILASYDSELADLDKRLAKLSPIVRKSLGGKSLDRFRKRVRESHRKLQVHQEATIDRLTC